MARTTGLPYGALPRGLKRDQAAEYVGVSTGTFDTMVSDGRMPRPLTPHGKLKVWDRYQLDAAFERLPGSDGGGGLRGWEDVA